MVPTISAILQESLWSSLHERAYTELKRVAGVVLGTDMASGRRIGPSVRSDRRSPMNNSKQYTPEPRRPGGAGGWLSLMSVMLILMLGVGPREGLTLPASSTAFRSFTTNFRSTAPTHPTAFRSFQPAFSSKPPA